MYGTNESPLWASVLAAASDWGIPPWEISDELPVDKVGWFFRWIAYRNELTRAEKSQRELSEHKAKVARRGK